MYIANCLNLQFRYYDHLSIITTFFTEHMVVVKERFYCSFNLALLSVIYALSLLL